MNPLNVPFCSIFHLKKLQQVEFFLNEKSFLFITERIHSSGWQDSNLRPPGPKPGAMTGLRYTPNSNNWSANIKLLFVKQSII